ncbi:hypothetical protein IFO70_00990 [Phormidium tenue FACHB-886]|nr:hypothetical protein [Phormidium tenue FACHB-886]
MSERLLKESHPSKLAAPLAGLSLSLLAGILLAVAPSAQAQTGVSADLQTPVGASDLNSQRNGDLGSFDSMFNLFHQLQRGGVRDPYEFNRSQRESLNTAASDFRQRQLELLQQRQQPGAPSGAIVPAAPAAAPVQINNP